MGKKVELIGNFTYGFSGSAGQWFYRLNNEELDPQIISAIENVGIVSAAEFDEPPYRPRKTAGKLKITVEQMED